MTVGIYHGKFIANLEHKTKKYPCMICLIKACCSELCELLTEDKHTMYESLENNICPDCFSTNLIRYKHGGAYGQFKCLGCGHVFVINPACYLVNERRLK